MKTHSKSTNSNFSKPTFSFKIIKGESKSYPKGRTGTLISKTGERIPFKVIYCSKTGDGIFKMPDTYYKKMRA
jgi:hypothetical protein